VSTPSDRSTPRREFIGQLTASAIVLAGAACATPPAAGQSATTPAPAPTPGNPTAAVHWDDSWFGRLTAKHKAVFDSPAFEDGLAVSQASGYIRGMRDALGAGPNDVQAVVVMRHVAIPMIFNDAMWAKYEIGKQEKVTDGGAEKWATRNPFLSSTRPSASTDQPQATLMWLGSHGHILLGCDLATRRFASNAAKKTNSQTQTVYDELKANLVPGVILQPTGVYAVHRAQEAGCSYIRST
jgi:hypothetical protein